MQDTVLTAFAMLLFLLAGFGVPHDTRWNLVALGLACLTATLLF